MAIAARPRLKPIALPAEHGGWGLVGAPILLGLLVAGSPAGVLLAGAALGAFLARQPLRLAISDLSRGKRYPRTWWAMRFGLGFALVATAGFGFALAWSDHVFWPPLIGCVVLGSLQFRLDLKGRGHTLSGEILGALAMAPLATAIAMAGGVRRGVAFWLALVLMMQSVNALLYVRARLRLTRGDSIDPSPVWIGHALALLLVSVGVLGGHLGPWLALAFLVLLLRSAWGLSPWRRPVSAPIVGVQEVTYTLLTVLCAAASFAG